MSVAAPSPAYRAARERAACLLTDVGLIVVSGRDRASYLQGLLTNDVAALASGQGCYSAYLTAQGRMLTDLHVYELGDVMLLTLPLTTKDMMLQRLDQFIFTEDVQLADASASQCALALIGPAAHDLLLATLTMDDTGTALASMPMHGVRRASYAGETVIVTRIDRLGEAGYEIVSGRSLAAGLQATLLGAGGVPLDAASADALRVEAGIPLWGVDMSDDTIPLEAGIEQRAISFTKGCYVGQEVIIRVLHRGHGRVARKLVGLEFPTDAAVPAPGLSVLAQSVPVGEVTSGAWSPARGRPLALGYVKRDFLEPGTGLVTPDGLPVTVAALPFAR